MADSKTYTVKLSDGREFDVTTEGGAPSEEDVLNSLKMQPPASAKSWWDNHPTIKQLATGAVDTLPGVGAIAGSVLGAPGGPLTVLGGTALGAGVGKGARDLIAESTGLAPPTSPWAKAGGIALDTALTAAVPGVIEAIKSPLSTAKEAATIFENSFPEKLRPRFVKALAEWTPTNGAAQILERPTWQQQAGSMVSDAVTSAPKPRLTGVDFGRFQQLVKAGLSDKDAFAKVIELKGK